MKRSRIKSQRGLTLIELMTTVVIVGIVSAMAIPKFQQASDRIRFASSSRDLVSTLRLARSLALTEKEPHGVQVNDNRIIILFKDISDLSLFTYVEGEDSLIRVDTLPREFEYLGTDMVENTLVFSRSGTANFNGGGNIWALASSDNIMGIYNYNILAATGRVQAESYYY